MPFALHAQQETQAVATHALLGQATIYKVPLARRTVMQELMEMQAVRSAFLV
jgi:hypothetical protein